MKKILSITIATLIAFAFISCSNPTTPDAAAAPTDTGTSGSTDTTKTDTTATSGTTTTTTTTTSKFTALSLADVKYDAAGAGGLDGVKGTPGKVGLWYDAGNWVGATVTVANVTAAAGGLSFDYTVTGKCDYGVQLFDTIATNGTYLVTATVTAGVSQDIVFNGHKYSLTAKAPTSVSSLMIVNGATASAGGTVISLQLPVDGTGIAASSSFKIADAKYVAVSASDLNLSALSLSSTTATIAAGDSAALTVTGTYTYTDTDSQKYTVYSAPAASDVTWSSSSASVATVSGGAVKGVAAGTATITATSGGKSATCEVTVNATKDYGKYFSAASETDEATSHTYPGYMCVWYDQNYCGSIVTLSNMSASATTYSLTRSTTGANWFGTQLFYSATAGTYDVSFTVTSTVAGDITVNGAVQTLVANTAKTISYTKTLGSTDTLIGIQLGAKTAATQLGDGTLTIDALTITAK